MATQFYSHPRNIFTTVKHIGIKNIGLEQFTMITNLVKSFTHILCGQEQILQKILVLKRRSPTYIGQAIKEMNFQYVLY